MPTAARVYAEQLLPRGHGLPLWEPEPSELGEVDIGDVGFVDEGGFCRLFNATRDKDDPLNVCGVPDGFVILEYNERALRHTSLDYVLPGPIYSSSVRQFSIGGGPSVQGIGGSYKFSCTSNQGALVILGDHGTLSLVRKNTVFEQYMRTHRDAWLDFALALGHNIGIDDLVLVSGWTKTSQWALAACTNFGRAHEVSLDASFGAIAGAKFEVKLCQDVQMSVDQRSGPSRTAKDMDETLPRDQCLFLRYYKMKRNAFGVKKIVAGSGPKRQSSYDETERHSDTGVLSDDHRTRGAPRHRSYDDAHISRTWPPHDADEYSDLDEISEEPSAIPQADPLDVLLDYILGRSVAEVAIVCHEDLYNICSGEWPINIEAFVHNSAPPIHVDEYGVGTLRHRGDLTHPFPHIRDHAVAAEPPDSYDHAPLDTISEVPSLDDVSSTGISETVAVTVDLDQDKSKDARSDVDTSSETLTEGESGISDMDGLDSSGVDEVAEEPALPTGSRSPLDLDKLLHQFRQSHDYERHRPHHSVRRAHPPAWAPWSCGGQPLAPTVPLPQEKAPGPDKYSAKVLCTAPLGYIMLYRACTRFTTRPHLAAVHLSAGVAMSAVMYGKQRRARGVYAMCEAAAY